MPNDFTEAIQRHQSAFGLDLTAESIEDLDRYYRFVLENNPVVHLVGKCSDEEFAVRHILESIYLLTIAGRNRTFVDVGSGAGLPGIPCLIASKQLRGFLVESKLKKGRFLEEAIGELGLSSRCVVHNRQFSEIKKPNAGVVVTRALDKLVKKLPKLIEWSGRSTVAVFAGPSVRDELERLKIEYSEFLIPMSERRYLFTIDPPAKGRRKLD